MNYNALGTTGLFVSQLGLGTMSFGRTDGPYAAGQGVMQAEAEHILAHAVDAGINFVDTANIYTDGQSEEILGRALKKAGIARHNLVIATKSGHATGPGPNDSGASRYHVTQQVHQSLKRLGTDHIDLYQMHGWDPATPIEQTIRALEDLVRQGCIRYIGVSNYTAWQIATALGVAERLNMSRFQSVQAYYSLVGRELEREIIPAIQAHQLGLLVYSPLAGGYLSGKYRTQQAQGRRTSINFPPVDEAKGDAVLSVMDGIATAQGTSMSAIALAWLLHQPSVTSVILGIKRLEQLEENLTARPVKLSEQNLSMLAEVSKLPVEYPVWAVATSEAARNAFMRHKTRPN